MKRFITTEKIKNVFDTNSKILIENEGLDFIHSLLIQQGGHSYNKGLFKVHTFSYMNKWTHKLQEYFKEEIHDGDFFCFASDWRGNMYCVNSSNSKIIYFDPATMEFFESSLTLEQFMNDVLPSEEYDILSEEYFEEVRKYLHVESLPFDKSFGHKVFLHLGGEDDARNMEIIDTEVLWELQKQITDRINQI